MFLCGVKMIKKNTSYIDLFSLLADSNQMLIEKYSDDGIHLNAEGFTVWTNLIKPYLENI